MDSSQLRKNEMENVFSHLDGCVDTRTFSFSEWVGGLDERRQKAQNDEGDPASVEEFIAQQTERVADALSVIAYLMLRRDEELWEAWQRW